jgi:hypothetical protein
MRAHFVMKQRNPLRIFAVEQGNPALALPDVYGMTIHKLIGLVKGLFVAHTFGFINIDDVAGLVDDRKAIFGHKSLLHDFASIMQRGNAVALIQVKAPKRST